ncbi:MAG: hypothetical protein COA44_14450 [Arcobacter sp.]|nr:MAG: hypothetical protein COA44_14450 [Arcobacter sp.]
MSKINWDEYKKYKHESPNLKKLDNFEVLLEFLRSFYNKTSAFEVFDTLNEDELGKMMLDKRDITQPEQLEDLLYKRLAK